jgi:hypothetical protein
MPPGVLSFPKYLDMSAENINMVALNSAPV